MLSTHRLTDMTKLTKKQIQDLASKGRGGDTMLAHINPQEARLLKERGGSGAINPNTGLPEFKKFWKQASLSNTKAAVTNPVKTTSNVLAQVDDKIINPVVAPISNVAAKIDDKIIQPVVQPVSKALAKVEDVVKEEILAKPAGQLLLMVAMPYAAAYIGPFVAAALPAGVSAATITAISTAVAQTAVAVASGVPFEKALESAIINTAVNIGAEKFTPYVNDFVKNPQITSAIVNASATVAQGVATGQTEEQIKAALSGSLAGSTAGMLNLIPGYSELPVPAKNVISSTVQAQLLNKPIDDAATQALLTSGLQSAANGVIAYKKISDKFGRPATADEIQKFAFYSTPSEVNKDIDSYVKSKSVTEEQVRKAFSDQGVTNLTPQQIEKYVKADVDQDKLLEEASAEADPFATSREEVTDAFMMAIGRPPTDAELAQYVSEKNEAEQLKNIGSNLDLRYTDLNEVKEQFRDVFGRDPREDELQKLQAYVGENIEKETVDRANKDFDLLVTDEDEIKSFFNTQLGRDPTPEEVMQFKGEVEENNQFKVMGEYVDPLFTDVGEVTKLFQDNLGRNPSEEELQMFVGSTAEVQQLPNVEKFIDPMFTDVGEVTEFFKDTYGRDPSEAEAKALASTNPEDTLSARADQAIRQANTEAFETLAGYKPEEGGIGINVVTDPLFAQARLEGVDDFEPPPKPFADPNKFNINPFSKEAYLIDIDADGNQRQIKVIVDSATNKLVSATGSLEDDARVLRSLNRMGVKTATIPNELYQALAHFNPDLLKNAYVPVAERVSLTKDEANALLGIFDTQAKTASQQAAKLYKATEFFKVLGKANPLSTLFDLLTYTGEVGAPEEIEFEKLQRARIELAQLWESLNPPPLKPLTAIEIDPSGRDITTVVLDYDSQGRPIEYYVPTIVKAPLDSDADDVLGYDSKGQKIIRDNYIIKDDDGKPMQVDVSASEPQRVTQEDLDKGIIGYSFNGNPISLERLFPEQKLDEATILPKKDPQQDPKQDPVRSEDPTKPIDLIPKWKPRPPPPPPPPPPKKSDDIKVDEDPVYPFMPSTDNFPNYSITINPETGKPWEYVAPPPEKLPDRKPVKPKVVKTKAPELPEEVSFAQQFNPQDSTSLGVAPKPLKPTFLASQETDEPFASPLSAQAPEEIQETIQAPQEFQTFAEQQPSDVEKFRELLNLQNEQIVTPAEAEDRRFAQAEPTSPLSLSDMTQQPNPEMPMYFNFGKLGAPETSPYYKFGELQSIDSFFNPDYQNLQVAKGGLITPLMAAGGATGTRYGRYAGGGMTTPLMASGGKLRVDFRSGDAVSGEGDGQSDDIPAMLADGEFVFPADVVAAIGNGSTKAGSDKLYDMMHGIRSHVRSAKPQDLPPEIKSPLDFLHRKPKKARS